MQVATPEDVSALELLAIELEMARAVSVAPENATATESALGGVGLSRVRLCRVGIPDEVLHIRVDVYGRR